LLNVILKFTQAFPENYQTSRMSLRGPYVPSLNLDLDTSYLIIIY